MDENQNNRENVALCPQCGAPLKSGVNFCGKCGFKVKGNKNSEPAFNDFSEVIPQEKEPLTAFKPLETEPMNNSSFQNVNLNAVEEEAFAPIKQDNLSNNDPFSLDLNQGITTAPNPISDPTLKNQESKKESQMEHQNSNIPFELVNENFKIHDIDNQLAFSNQKENLNEVSLSKESSGETKYCNKCGAQLKINSKFCSACGASTEEDSSKKRHKGTNSQGFQEGLNTNTKYVRKSKAGKSAATEKMNVFKSLISNVPEEKEEVSPFATDLPNWSIEPPVIPVQRKRRKS